MPPFYTYISAGTPFTGLLNEYPGAAAAYSLRKLNGNYNGNAIRVRRDNDNLEIDIGFVSNELDTASLLSFVGANNGYVTTWYDQSGNNADAVQSTQLKQPQIVNLGAVIQKNSIPAVLFNGHFFDLGSYAFGNDCNIVWVGQGTNVLSGIIAVQNNTTANLGMQFWSFQSKYTSFNSTTANKIQHVNNTDYVVLQYGRNTSSMAYMQVNGTLQNITPTTIDTNIRSYYLGTIEFGNFLYAGTMQEVVIYENNKFLELNGIESNINSYYSIY